MSHKKNDLSYSEGGIDRQTSTSSNSSNPWGVSLNRLSFKTQPKAPAKNASSKNPYNYISNSKNQNQNQKDNNNKPKPKPKQQPKPKPKPKPKAKAKRKSIKKKEKEKIHTYERSDVIPPTAFASSKPMSPTESKKENNSDASLHSKKKPMEKAKKRKLRRQLSLAKMQMSVLKARLGLEQMKSPRTIQEDEMDTQYVMDTPSTPSSHTNGNGHNEHSRSASVSSESLFATIESMGSFENDIKDAIQKVDGLMLQINQQKDNELKDECHQLTDENKKLKHELDDIKKKLKEVSIENIKLKKSETQSPPRQHIQKQSIVKEFKPDPLEQYNRMKDLGMSIDAIVSKMEKAQIDRKQISEWKKKNSSQSADQVLASKVNAKEELYAKYDKMKKIGMPNDSIRNKMRMDGLKLDEIDRYLNESSSDNKAQDTEDAFKQKMAKYDRMNKMGMPQHVIENKMRLDGISDEEHDKYFNINTNQGSASQASEDLSKYERMKKMGMPMHAIVNKMRLDGISGESMDNFENPNKKKNKTKKTIKASNPQLAKYERMKKMGMPMHAIVNKMRLDGIEPSLVHSFEKDDDDTEDESEDEDPNEANTIDLNIPALAKYNRMKKMGMPVHAIVNKMKLDGIDTHLVNAFENPEKGKEKGKKKGFSGLFHKRKSSLPPKEKIKPNVDMKRFHWQTLDYKLARNSIWKTMDEKAVTASIDIAEFEALFSIPKKSSKLVALMKGKGKDKKSEKKSEEIKFVSAKRQYNVELLLKRLKFDGAKLCDDIIRMNESKLNLDLLIKVSDMVPSDEEQMQAIGCSNKGNKSTIAKYGIVESFFYDLSSIWSLQERIKLWIFKKEFAEICQHQSDKIHLLNKGLSDIQGSEGLYEIFKIILAFGNYMNGGRRNGCAYGFSLETLRMLSGTKGGDGRTTLLMYIYKYTKADAKGKGKGEMDVVKELENVCAAVKIDIDALDKKIKDVSTELDKLPLRLKEFEKQTAKVKNDVYVATMNEWFESARVMMSELRDNFKEMEGRATALAATYAYKLEGGPGAVSEFLAIFNDFICDWKKAKIKYTKMEEKRKKDALRAKKKSEAQRKLQLKLSKKMNKSDLEKKNILKDKAKVSQERALNAKLKKTLKAHVRKQTVMKQMFGDVLNQSDEEEEEPEQDQDATQLQSNVSDASAKKVQFDDAKSNKKTPKSNKNKLPFEYRSKKQQYATPTATQFGNVWELNFSPMSRTAYSQSNTKKKKKTKYKSGHVRRETRLKKAFETMAAGSHDEEAPPDHMEKTKNTKNIKTKTQKSKKQNNKVIVTSPRAKSKGTEMYSKYKTKNRFNKDKPKSNMQMEF